MPERVAVVCAVEIEQCDRSEFKRIFLVVPFTCVKGCHVKLSFFSGRRLDKSSMVEL